MAAATRAKGKPDRAVILVGGNLTAAQWRRYEQAGMSETLDIDELDLVWTDKHVTDLDAKGAITAVQIDATLEAAPTVTITLRDPRQHLFARTRTETVKRSRKAGPVDVDEGWDAILPPDVLGRPMQVTLDGVTYRLVKAAYTQSSGEVALTFEHELVYLLKRHKGAKHAPRAKTTRAQFVLSLVRELGPDVKPRQYRFVCPELNLRQPIDTGQRQKTAGTARTTATSSGGSGGRSIDRVFPAQKSTGGERLSVEQVRACAAAGGFWGQELTAMEQIAHGESSYRPGALNLSGDGGIGLWQMTPYLLLQGGKPNWGPEAIAHLNKLGGTRAMRNPVQNAKMARYLYEQAGKTFQPWFGTDYLTVGSGPGNGKPSREESKKLAETVTSSGSTEGTAGSKTVTTTKSYQFKREAKESSWAAITRLATEVKWRAYLVGNSLYYMSEEALYERRPAYFVCPPDYEPPKDSPELATDAVLDLTYDVDWGKPVSEATLTVTLARWDAPPGSVIVLEGYGPPDGRWLVASTSRDYFAPTATVNLVQPGKAALEPANTTTTTTTGGSSSSSSSQSGGSGSSAARKFYDRAVAIDKKNYDYAWSGGHNAQGTPGRDSRGTGGFGYDCSGYVGACLLAAGVAYDGRGSGTFGSLPGAKPGTGKEITVHYNAGHVYAVFERGLGVNYDRADTNPVGGGPRGPHLRKGTGYGSYSLCHWNWD